MRLFLLEHGPQLFTKITLLTSKYVKLIFCAKIITIVAYEHFSFINYLKSYDY